MHDDGRVESVPIRDFDFEIREGDVLSDDYRKDDAAREEIMRETDLLFERLKNRGKKQNDGEKR